MRRPLLIFLLVSTCHVGHTQTLTLEHERAKLGRVTAAQPLAHRFNFTNTGVALLEIQTAQSTCSCVHVAVGSRIVAPGAASYIEVGFDAPAAPGRVRRVVRVVSNDTANPVRRLMVTARVPEPPGAKAGEARAIRKGAALAPAWAEGEVLVRFRGDRVDLSRGADAARRRAIAGAKACKDMEIVQGRKHLACLILNENETVEAAVERLEDDPDVIYAQPNHFMEPRGLVPDDDFYDRLYGMDQIQAPDAWEIFQGVPTGNGGIVAVIDNGVDSQHDEFQGRMWEDVDCLDHQGEFLGDCDKGGYDFTGSGDKDPRPSGNDHGTHVAGTVAATGNNGIGVAGVAWNIKIMAIRSRDYKESELIKGIYFAKYNGASVINASWGWGERTCEAGVIEALYDAIAEFPGLFVGAAGNNGNEHDGQNWFDSTDYGHDLPCAMGLDNVINVAATNDDDELASSNFRSDYGPLVDIAAPGDQVYSTGRNDSYNHKSGTSMAAPHAAGVAALLWGLRPELSVAEVRCALIRHGDCVNSLSGELFPGGDPAICDGELYCDGLGGARLNAYRTLAAYAVPTITELQAFTGVGLSTPISDGGNTDDSQPYWTWLAPVGQGIMEVYEILIDGGATFTGSVAATAFDAAAEQVILTPGQHTIEVIGRNDQGARGGPVSHTVVISSESPIISFVNLPANIEEGDEFRVDVELVNSADEPVSADYVIGDPARRDVDDYTPGGGALSWEAGETGIRSFMVVTTHDDIHEADEEILIFLSNSENAIIYVAEGTVTIINNDDPPTISVTDAEISENAIIVAIEVMLDGETELDAFVEYKTIDGTAAADLDYTAVEGSLSWSPGDSAVKSVTVPILDDADNESDETFTLVLSDALNADIGDPVATVRIHDDEAPFLNIGDVVVAETDDSATIPVTIIGTTTEDVRVVVATGGGDAVAGEDYTATSATLTWNSGDTTSRSLTIPINDDVIDEFDETIAVMLEAPVNAVLDDDSGVVTILDDDEPPFITVNPTSSGVEQGELVFRIKLSPESGKTISFTYAVESTEAVVGQDFAATFGNGQLAPGAIEAIVTVPVLTDSEEEADEIVTLTISQVTNVSPARSDFTADGRITDDDVLYQLAGGWSMIGSPFTIDDVVSTVATRDAGDIVFWRWVPDESRYELTAQLLPGEGYMVFCPGGADLAFEGMPAADTTVELVPGWNLVGPFHDLSAASLAGVAVGDIWGWDGAAAAAVETLLRKSGYWIYVGEAQLIDLGQ